MCTQSVVILIKKKERESPDKAPTCFLPCGSFFFQRMKQRQSLTGRERGSVGVINDSLAPLLLSLFLHQPNQY